RLSQRPLDRRIVKMVAPALSGLVLNANPRSGKEVLPAPVPLSARDLLAERPGQRQTRDPSAQVTLEQHPDALYLSLQRGGGDTGKGNAAIFVAFATPNQYLATMQINV